MGLAPVRKLVRASRLFGLAGVSGRSRIIGGGVGKRDQFRRTWIVGGAGIDRRASVSGPVLLDSGRVVVIAGDVGHVAAVVAISRRLLGLGGVRDLDAM